MNALDALNAEALRALARSLLAEGRWAEAAALPAPTPDLLIARGQALLGLRRDAESLECFDQAIDAQPGCAAADCGRCQALLRLGRVQEALAGIDRLMAKHPDSAQAQGVRAQILFGAGKLEEAWEAANRAGTQEPAEPAALLVRALVLSECSDHEAALSEFEAALKLDPVLPAAHQGRARSLAALGRSEEAIEAFTLASRVDPNNAWLAVRAGHLRARLNQFGAALDAFATALQRQPDNAVALQGQAQCLAALGRPLEAVDAYTRLLEVAPNADYMPGERFHLKLHCCDWRDFGPMREALAARVRSGERADNPGSFLAHSESPADQLACARTFAADFCAGPEQAMGTPRSIPRSKRLRLAYLSADFFEHPTAYLAAGLFEAHDRARFETYALSFGPKDESPMRRRLERAFDRFEDVGHLSDEQIAARVRALGIDIAVDLKGHTLGGRPRIFALRPSPLQVSLLAYPGTLGADFMDYLVADRQVIPEEERRHYAEQIIYLPGSYQVNSMRVAGPAVTRRSEGLAEHAFVFCCFNSSYKINPLVFDDWMAILKAVPQGILWVLEGSAEAVRNLKREAAARGVDPARLVFAPWKNLPDHLARCVLADLVLDTYPYNAHTTASDALWSSVPIVTRAGRTFASRVASSLLHAVGLGRLSVGSSEEYRRLAIQLATSPAEMTRLKQALAEARRRSTLFDPVWYCRQLEAAFAGIAARHRRGERPSPLELAAV